MAANSKITVKRKGKAKGKVMGGRQTKLPMTGQNSLKLTEPSAFGDPIDPALAEYNAEPKPKSTGRVKKPKPEGKDGADDTLKEEEKKKKKIAAAKSVRESFLGSDNEEGDILVAEDAKKKKKIAKAKPIKAFESDSEDEEVIDLASRIARPSRVKAAPTSYTEMDITSREGSEVKSRSPDDEPESDYNIIESDSEDDFIPAKKPKVKINTVYIYVGSKLDLKL